MLNEQTYMYMCRLCLWNFEFVFLVHLSFGHKVVILVLCRPSCFFIIRPISIWRRLLPELTRARWLWRHKDQNSERQRFETTNSVLTGCSIVTALGWFRKSSCILVDPKARNIQDPWLFFNFVFFQLLIEWIVSGWNVRENQQKKNLQWLTYVSLAPCRLCWTWGHKFQEGLSWCRSLCPSHPPRMYYCWRTPLTLTKKRRPSEKERD